jgi:hypothetical protein
VLKSGLRPVEVKETSQVAGVETSTGLRTLEESYVTCEGWLKELKL